MNDKFQEGANLPVAHQSNALSLAKGFYPATFDSMAKTFSVPEGKIMLLYGDPALFKFSMLLMAQSTRGGMATALIDGSNRFDLHSVTRYARERGLDPQALLNRIFVSRGFTCYQMEAAVTTKLQAFLSRTGAKRAFIFGLLDTFYDEQAPLREVQQILLRLLRGFDDMRKQGISLLLSCTEWNVIPAERNRFLEKLRHNADAVYHLAPNEQGNLQLFEERKMELPPDPNRSLDIKG